MVGYTAEALSHGSSLIALGTPIDVVNVDGPGDVRFTKTRFRLDEVIKGPASSGDALTVYDYSYKKTDVLELEKAKKQKKQLLVLARVCKRSFKEIDGKYVFARVHGGKSAYYPDRPVSDVFTPDFHVVANVQDLLKRIRRQVASEEQFLRTFTWGAVEMKRVEVPGASEAYRRLYAGSACYLYVPEYIQQKARASRLRNSAVRTDGVKGDAKVNLPSLSSDDVNKRRQAAAELCISLLKKNRVWRRDPFNWKIPTEEGLKAEVRGVRSSDQSAELAIANMCAHSMSMLPSRSWREPPIAKIGALEKAIIGAVKANRDPVVRMILLVGLASSGGEAARDVVVASTADRHPGVRKGACFLVERCTAQAFGPVGVIHVGSELKDVKIAGERIRGAYWVDRTFGLGKGKRAEPNRQAAAGAASRK